MCLTIQGPQEFIPGFSSALELVRAELPEDDIPPVTEFFPSPGDDDFDPNPPRRYLSRKLLRAIQEKTRKRLVQVATDVENAVMVATSHETCADFLFVSPVETAFRMGETFVIAARRYLGLPVARPICNIDTCTDVSVHPFGAHGHHAPGKITKRHHSVVDGINSLISFHAPIHGSPTETRKEIYLDDVGHALRPDAKDTSRARCDIMFSKQNSGYKVFTDVTVVDVNVTNKYHATRPLYAALKAETAKFKRYCDNWDVTEAQIKPLVFETYGGYSTNTFEFLRETVRGIAGSNDALYGKLWRKLRGKIAVAIAKGEAELILRLNSINPNVVPPTPSPQTRRTPPRSRVSPRSPRSPQSPRPPVRPPVRSPAFAAVLRGLRPSGASRSPTMSVPATSSGPSDSAASNSGRPPPPRKPPDITRPRIGPVSSSSSSRRAIDALPSRSVAFGSTFRPQQPGPQRPTGRLARSTSPGTTSRLRRSES